MNLLIGSKFDPSYFTYSEDIAIVGATFDEHLKNFQEVFCHLRAANLNLTPKSASFDEGL